MFTCDLQKCRALRELSPKVELGGFRSRIQFPQGEDECSAPVIPPSTTPTVKVLLSKAAPEPALVFQTEHVRDPS